MIYYNKAQSSVTKSLGLPYMGSKRKLANKIVGFIIDENPNVKYVYDLFGGGGAISFEFLKYPQVEKVIYNELNTGIVELLKDVLYNGVTEKYNQWVDRETFMKHKNDNDWFGGLCKCIWSFGNSQASYLFGKDIEEYKKNYHLVVVNKINKLTEMKEFIESYVFKKYNIKENINLIMPVENNLYKRKLEIRKQLNIYEKDCKLNQLRQLQQLQQLERLQQLQQLQQLERLEILNYSYENININTPINETIIYLDPPYENTGKYQNDIKHNLLYEWIKKSPYKIYLSSYKSELFECASFNHRCTLLATANNRVEEKLFCNRKSLKNDINIF